MITRTQLIVMRAIERLARDASDPNISVSLTVTGLSVEQLSDVLDQLVRLGLLRHFFDFADGEVSVLVEDITPLGCRVLSLARN
jgi:hypothetical protein